MARSASSIIAACDRITNALDDSAVVSECEVDLVYMIHEAYCHGVSDALSAEIERGDVTDADVVEMADLFVDEVFNEDGDLSEVEEMIGFNDFLDSDEYDED
jgi:hypothetical protein